MLEGFTKAKRWALFYVFHVGNLPRPVFKLPFVHRAGSGQAVQADPVAGGIRILALLGNHVLFALQIQGKCEQLLADTMAKVEDMYSQAKTKTENMLSATEAECSKLKEETKNFVEKMRNTAEMEVAKLKVVTEDTCKRRTNTAEAEAAKTLETARTEANKMMMEANVNYRKIVGDAEERCRKIIFDAESRASLAENAYNNQVKKAMVHRNHMMHLLKTQMELLENFEDHTVE